MDTDAIFSPGVGATLEPGIYEVTYGVNPTTTPGGGVPQFRATLDGVEIPQSTVGSTGGVLQGEPFTITFLVGVTETSVLNVQNISRDAVGNTPQALGNSFGVTTVASLVIEQVR